VARLIELGTVLVFRQKSTLEDAIGSHACSLKASMRVTNGIPLGRPLLLPVRTVNCVQTLKVHQHSWSLQCRLFGLSTLPMPLPLQQQLQQVVATRSPASLATTRRRRWILSLCPPRAQRRGVMVQVQPCLPKTFPPPLPLRTLHALASRGRAVSPLEPGWHITGLPRSSCEYAPRWSIPSHFATSAYVKYGASPLTPPATCPSNHVLLAACCNRLHQALVRPPPPPFPRHLHFATSDCVKCGDTPSFLPPEPFILSLTAHHASHRCRPARPSSSQRLYAGL
jgi:hypothetical protein